MRTGPKQSEIATALGLTPGRITQLKKQGMPVTSIEEARKWHATHNAEGTGHKNSQHNPAVTAAAEQLANLPRPITGNKPEDENPESTLWRARQSEVACFDILHAAYGRAMDNPTSDNFSVIPGLLRTHAQAARNRLEAERQWDRHRVKIGAVVSLEYAKGVIASSFGPLDAQLATMPKRCAAQANPSDPVTAERAISDGVEAIRRQLDDNRFAGLTMPEIRAIFAVKHGGGDLVAILTTKGAA